MGMVSKYTIEERKKIRIQYLIDYRNNNVDKIKLKYKFHYEKNKQKIANYYQENKDHIVSRKKINYKNNKNKINEKCAKYYLKNRESILKNKIIYRKNNNDLMRLQSQIKRVRKVNKTGILSKDIAKKLFLLQKGKCIVCKCLLSKSGYHLDHIEPLSLNGMHDDDNIQLLCPPCNLSKHNKNPIEFMQKRGYLL